MTKTTQLLKIREMQVILEKGLNRSTPGSSVEAYIKGQLASLEYAYLLIDHITEVK